MELYDIILIILLIGVLVYWYLDRKFSYWARKNVPYEPAPSWIFGSTKEVLFKTKNSAFVYDEIYRKFEGKPYCGLYEFQRPTFLIRDPKLVQEVMVEKFNSFHHSKLSEDFNAEVNELLALNPFLTTGSRWKEVRTIVTSGMTPAKIRVLEEYFIPVFNKIKLYLQNNPNDINAFDVAKRYTSEMVALYGWGINGETFTQDKDLKQLFEVNQFADNTAVIVQHILPFLASWLRLSIHSKQFIQFMKQITGQAINSLEESKVTQSTFLQNLLNVREKLRQNGKDLSLKEISSHMTTFFTDGFETVGLIIGEFIQCLMMYPHVQQKLREEVNSVTEQVTIDLVNKLHYMEMVLSEIARRHTILSHFSRVCTEKCKIGDVEIDVGTPVIIPSYSLHFDEKYFPNPMVFNPENFTEENISKRPKFTHFVFGHGPRICPGMRYALANVKLFIFHLVKEYEILPPTDHPANTMEYGTENPLFLLPKGELYVKFRKLK